MINIKYLQALQHLAATNNVRTYLEGVYVSFDYRHTTYTATDGHVLGRFIEKHETDGPEYLAGVNLIIPNRTIRQLKGSKLSVGRLSILNAAEKEWRIDYEYKTSSNSLLFKPIDAKFPDINKVIPDCKGVENGKPGNFDIELLSRFVKVSKCYGVKHYPGLFTMNHNGKHTAALLTNSAMPEFTGVIMPFR